MSVRNRTTIRPFTIHDIATLVDMTEREVPKIRAHRGVAIDRERVRQVLLDALDAPDRFCVFVLVNEEGNVIGGIAGYITVHLLNWDKVAGDIFMFVDPEWRTLRNAVRLVTAYKDWAVSNGAKAVDAFLTNEDNVGPFSEMLRRYAGFDRIGIFHRCVV